MLLFPDRSKNWARHAYTNLSHHTRAHVLFSVTSERGGTEGGGLVWFQFEFPVHHARLYYCRALHGVTRGHRPDDANAFLHSLISFFTSLFNFGTRERCASWPIWRKLRRNVVHELSVSRKYTFPQERAPGVSYLRLIDLVSRAGQGSQYTFPASDYIFIRYPDETEELIIITVPNRSGGKEL